MDRFDATDVTAAFDTYHDGADIDNLTFDAAAKCDLFNSRGDFDLRNITVPLPDGGTAIVSGWW